MDIGAEISKKIQMAITAKLKELDAYVDDELPDYIMIMVANKKSEEQMTDALSLFLSGNTKTFTSWLHNLLSSLRKGKVDKGQTNKESKPMERVSEETPQRRSSTDYGSKPRKASDQHKSTTAEQSAGSKSQSEAIITIDNNEMQELFDEELIAESSAAELMAPQVPADVMPAKAKLLPISQVEPNLEMQQGVKTKSSKANNAMKRKPSETSSSESLKAKTEKAQKVNPEKLDKKKTKTYKEPSFKRSRSNNITSDKPVREWDRGKGKDLDEMPISGNYRKHGQNRDRSFYSDSESDDETIKKGRVSSTVNQMMQNTEFVSESDSEEESKSKVSSRVTYPKRTMRVPLNKQANKALFMKAVNAAEKSVKTSGVSTSKTDVQFDETEPKAPTSRKSKQLIRAGKREYAENDARRKLQIKKAISEAFQSQLVTSSRKSKTTIGDRRTSLENSNHLEMQGSKPVKRAKVTDKMPKGGNHSPPECHPQSDQRKFIIQTKRKQIDDPPVVAFDSREALPRSSQEDANTNEKTLPPSSTSNINSGNETMPSSHKPPNFIVTMDGVIRSKHKSQLSEDERKAARIKKFKSETSTDAAKVLLAKTEKPSSAMQELEKMKDKILQVERESSKLKQMQIKLAAVQNGTVTPSGNEQRSISVANVHYSTTEKQLSDYFSICGKVLRTTILRDIGTGHPKGFAYLEFEDTGAVASALALNNTQLNNRVIRVTIKPPSATPTYQPYRGYQRPYRGRVTRGFSPQGRFARFSAHKAITRNKTWVNPTISGINKS